MVWSRSSRWSLLGPVGSGGIHVWLSRAVLVAMVVLLAARIQASLGERESGLPFDHTQRDGFVTAVDIGSMAWLAGVRPGMAYVRWPRDDGGDTGAPDGEIGMADTVPVEGWATAVLAVLSVLLVLAARAIARPLGAVLAVLVASLLALDLLGIATYPVALAVVLVPALALAWLGSELRNRSRTVSLVGAGAAVSLVALLAIAPAALPWAETWWVIALVPALVAMVITAVAAFGAIRRWRRAPGRYVPLPAALVASTPAGRVAISGAVERERDAHAQWLHDRVLPRLSAGLGSVDAGDTIVGAATLRSLAHDLRDDIDQEQLTVLRWAGLPAALEDALAPVHAAGIEAAISSHCEADTPPWHVQVAALRIGQEAVRNALLHASADRIEIDIDQGAHHLDLTVADDGVGLVVEDLRLARRAGHLGVPTMASLAADADAALDLVPNEPRGLRVVLRWPR